jgi:hypothetical protein
MTQTCENCTFFDTLRHENDARTKHAGICTKWTEIVFKSETCKWHFLKSNPDEKEIFIPLVDVTKLPSVTQLTFF